MAEAEPKVPVAFIAPREEIDDKTYNTGIWRTGETRLVEALTAAKLFKHVDVWTPGKAEDAVETSADNTKRDAKQSEEKLEEEASQNLRDQIQAMDNKQAIQEFAAVHYQMKIPANKGVQAMRDDLIGMVDRFGPR